MYKNNSYQVGFGSYFQTEAVEGALPLNQNSPQKPPLGLYAEQLSGSAFTRPRSHNLRSWLYRIYPSVKHHEFNQIKHDGLLTEKDLSTPPSPQQMRWDAVKPPSSKSNFIESLKALLFNGSVTSQSGISIYLYAANKSMDEDKEYFYNSDGELLIIPYMGDLEVKTEMGILDISPKEIVVIPRGVKFQINLKNKESRGYVCENNGSPFILPELGPIGANGLANPRDFLIPNAKFEDESGDFKLLNKFANNLWCAKVEHSPLDVVAWHGNYAPYKYDLTKFNTINTVSFDHPDPSIFTVLTSPSATPGVANVDFVIFPERWMVAEDTFRPPYYHRNIMSEYMGLICGEYNAKQDGFVPGGGSLHNCMSGHGPDTKTLEDATNASLEPHKQENTLAFMLESCLPFAVAQNGLSDELEQRDYMSCWKELAKNFSMPVA
jgi:homogentisate 1,2-dioxygenase